MGPNPTNPHFAQQPGDAPLKGQCGVIWHTILHTKLVRGVFSIQIGAVKGFGSDRRFLFIFVPTWRRYDICTIGGSPPG